MALSAKAKDGTLIIIDSLDRRRTARPRRCTAQLGKLGFGKTALVIDGDAVERRASRWRAGNLHGVNVLPGRRRQRLRHPEA